MTAPCALTCCGPALLAQPSAEPRTYRSKYVIPEFKKLVDERSYATPDLTLEATGLPGVAAIRTSGRQVSDPRSGQMLTWVNGARHTIKGELTILGYAFISDRTNPLVFQLTTDGYVYERGEGVVVTIAGERVYLRTALDAAGLAVQETIYGSDAPAFTRIALSPDGRHVATLMAGDPARVTRDGSVGTSWDAVDKESITFSPDSQHLAYMAKKVVRPPQTRRSRAPAAPAVEKWLVVLDGKPGAEYDALGGGSLIFSPDGKHLAYMAKSSAGWVVVRDERSGAEWDGIGTRCLTFSPDSAHLAYAAKKGAAWSIVVDDAPIAEYDGFSSASLKFSSDNKHLAYMAKKNGKWFSVLDGQRGSEYDDVAVGSLTFSLDGNHLAYMAAKGESWLIVRDGTASEEYGSVNTALTFSADGKHLAYVAKKANQWFAMLDGRYDATGYDGITDDLAFSPDGRHFAYAAKNGNTWSIVLDGKPQGSYDALTGKLVFSPDSKHFAYMVRRGGMRSVVLDDEAGAEYDGMRGEVIFSPDSAHSAYIAKKGSKWLVVLDGKPGAEYDAIAGAVAFSRDSRHVAYAAQTGNLWSVVLDGEPGPEYFSVWTSNASPSFNSDDMLEYMAEKGIPSGGGYRAAFTLVRYVPKSAAPSGH